MKLKVIFQTLLIVASMNAYSQKAKIKKADKNYENYAYIDAIKTYERVAEKGYKDAGMFQKLGNAYYFNAELDKANKWYGELFSMTQDVEPEYYYRYSQTLKSVGEYAKANEMLEQFNAKSGNDSRAKLYEQNKDYLKVIEENSGRYIAENAGINSEYSDYGTSFYGNQLVFASSRTVKGTTKKIQKWNNQAFTSLYASTVNGDGELLEPESFQSEIDSKYNESTPVFTNDGTTMYFTRNNYNDGKKRKDNERVTLLKLYRAKLKDGKFTNVTELPFNSDQYSTAHPALSTDEKTLYFASDMPGSLGQSDLYKVTINADGTFGTPQNLGNKINTEGKETFPFVSDDNELYFSSDGHQGLGGLDVFVSKINAGSFEEVVNVGAPVNGPMDDFAFMIDTKTQNGFFSSNREGGQGYDDIYKFKELRKLICEQLLAGIVTDASTGEILTDTKVTLLDEKMNKIAETYSDAKGYYSFDIIECKKKYYVRAEKREYVTVEETVVIGKETGETDLPIALEKAVVPVKIGDDLAKVFKIKIIYFDLDKSNIRQDAALDLAKIVDVMKENPTMKVDVRSHTDSRASFKYNESLSDRRARSTVAWMIEQGIEASRLTGKGYGESQLVNKCADGVQCSEEEHQQNRRSEFIITEL
ncbi:outer membrane protein OmpA-like peptidoglycan-associated protein/tetratricopeptide (TPR) repeat protein [Flavobacterium arsenatis]|uniref:Outer membrane protein OmpA-like peptidoglycan-associated protein/tetratricopeptide (TPR) repeat protein n=1 Tax=Flavobacterium arsenatis TaxID=1484332 RepID=A0ABU1TNE5_9FLAO|nr:OmpA family protein [Flavobacterium arsenatis]MDR6967332.1 outer membrane protein OmpA-like peptidoglycan-associated protein/tetratricopeptide (TPR) repeat protein [Flavobacterium arsenatis]